MKNLEEILKAYTRGDKPLDETNQELKELDCGLQLDPNRNVITPEELAETRVGVTPDEANGYGLMDHGVGCMEKVHVVNGKTVDVNMGEEYALVYIAGHKYQLKGDTLVEPEG